MQQDKQPADWRCKCCGKNGFVFVEEIGVYLCREAYLKYNKELLERAARFGKRPPAGLPPLILDESGAGVKNKIFKKG